ncbi:MAG TPA: alpha/beta hydrolase [Gemmatimonadaceae bacterium]|nr:alpha/beta hydrolase [Gemmatimonadaceae bacterium]
MSAGAAAAALLAAACAGLGGGPAARPADGPAPAASAVTTGAPAGTATSFDTTWYVSARARRDGRIVRAVADSLEYGYVVTRFLERVGPGTDGRYLEGFDETRVDSSRLPAAEFLRRVHAADSAAAARGEGAVVYVHGFAVSFGRALGQAAEIAHRGSFHGPMIVFEWPAHTALATWPTPSALISRAYRQDSASASASRGPFLQAVAALLGAVRPGALSVVGHSLGAQLVAEALAEPSPVHDTLEAHPLGAVALFAPDIPVARFRDSLAARLEAVAARRVVYASSSDWMLGISRLVNHAPRAGRTGAALTLAAHDVEVVDVTRGRRVDGSFRKLVEPRHAMRWASSALYDFFGVVRGLPAACRAADGVAARQPDGTWQLTPAPIPAAIPPAAEACAER